MNIFVLDTDVKRCAEYHCDRHVVKMILESAQILCTALWSVGVFNDSNTRLTPQEGQSICLYRHRFSNYESRIYRATHVNHPCCGWARDLRNWLWLRKLARALGEEYTYRYGKIHQSIQVINELPIPEIEVKIPEWWVLAMPEPYTNCDLVVESYREYYKSKKNKFDMRWTKREVPSWFN